MMVKFSAPSTPRPPETTIAASVSSGRPVDSRGVRAVTLVPALPVNATVTALDGAGGRGGLDGRWSSA